MAVYVNGAEILSRSWIPTETRVRFLQIFACNFSWKSIKLSRMGLSIFMLNKTPPMQNGRISETYRKLTNFFFDIYNDIGIF